jgi:hypothetical protein
MSDEQHAQPNVREIPKTEVAVLQGGPKHGRIIRVQVDHETVVMDCGNKVQAAYKRGITRPDGVAFDYVGDVEPAIEEPIPS